MITYENECRDCATDGYPCDRYCRYKRVKHFYCDACGDETELYYLDGKQLCISCVESELERVK